MKKFGIALLGIAWCFNAQAISCNTMYDFTDTVIRAKYRNISLKQIVDVASKYDQSMQDYAVEIYRMTTDYRSDEYQQRERVRILNIVFENCLSKRY